ncbi:MAG: glycoside hydrolase [Candidatus Andeanibacterium colombiense]|uniref:Glycoside hydrolase n=1 Tax=Candidatus Andeanibacterium colombiense TaxID=3121345 RepID=A0AAJ5X9P1_9SPHN|nr:MAG: glycoside hydrolase [Sphingomonadaceae bacterium]
MIRCLPLLLLLAGSAASAQRLPIDPFYTQHFSADGIPVIASSKPPAKALKAAKSMAEGMLKHRPDLARYLAKNGYTIAVIAQSEALLDLPENRDWVKPPLDDPRLTRCEKKHYDERIGRLTARQYWDERARGIGGQHMVGAEEDILGLPASRYWGETIFVHEFSHQILDAVRNSDRPLYAELEAAYAHAQATGLWLDEYNMTTIDEYWAEGSQFWWDSNRLQVFAGRRILNHQDLKAYDPALFAVLAKVFGTKHKLTGDPFWMSPARVPPGPPPENTAEVC